MRSARCRLAARTRHGCRRTGSTKRLERLATLHARDQTGPIAGGNAYSLVFDGDGVEAVFDYGDPNEEVELMSTDDFTSILERWRAAVLAAQAHETRAVPETYRRNPWPSGSPRAAVRRDRSALVVPQNQRPISAVDAADRRSPKVPYRA